MTRVQTLLNFRLWGKLTSLMVVRFSLLIVIQWLLRLSAACFLKFEKDEAEI
jgi:hypothetical protein